METLTWVQYSQCSKFRLDQLSFVSSTFLSGPIIMATGGTAGLLLSLVGACCIRKKQFNIYFGLSGLTALTLTVVVVSIVFSFMVRADIRDQLNKVNVRSELGRAARSEAVMELWDSLQERYQCCGAIGTSGA